METAIQCSIAIETAVKKRSKKVSSRLCESVIMSTTGQRRDRDGDIDKDTFRKAIIYPIVDIMIREMDRRYST